ncbi:energy-coupling factor transporter transmembrane protein EcfT [Limosilactobacillus sp. STM2_1]|uniref:Energy-coupling factor transporter transmembrane protein EcfT n=1 Tax=Limosilactobacillus rudii TaxID=2759755 RepID=A0A7W3UL03_9LACO|nr:energy-coupling factor transporter transmembrane component T [Limosilactobacillus rudii]MBB1079495.1 energy-coupling factor transporter transmembrane protein EcfT [Limosilactobacillus rudii]MBB1097541.1 energy-coupling factor transporter transmembrane protein EcfT [Limosilactobacillus rudii]MCD7134651.1 energy-coupling factor transporter transmembrane protein EcfT [Limosilactobacillus rudii]
MNPSLKLFTVLFISLELTFTSKLWANIIIIIGCLILLIHAGFRWQQFCWLVLVPLFPAIAIFITIVLFSPSHSLFYGLVLFSRLYMYVSLGTVFTFTTNPLALARSLEQNCHLPSKYAYGVLAALNLMTKMKQAVITIRAAGQMRGVVLHWWSPTLYFKAILVALQWSDQLAQAMESHGFVEGQARTSTINIPLTVYDWLITITLIVVIQIIIIALP